MRVIWSHAAQDDVLDIADYYDRIAPNLADEILQRLEDASVPLIDFSQLGELIDVEGDVRKRSVAGTPYILLYVVASDRVEVQRVVHARSDWRP